jgi:peptidoglycan-associated lipoprotein
MRCRHRARNNEEEEGEAMRKRQLFWVSTVTLLVAVLAITGCRGGLRPPWSRDRSAAPPLVVEAPKPPPPPPPPPGVIDVTPIAPPPEPDVRGRFDPAEDLEMIHFEFDKSTITEEAGAILERNGEVIEDNVGVIIQIEGHCDERGTNEYNIALGQRRATAARDYLIELGVDGGRLTTISYGEERPRDPRHNEDAWANNRRAQFGRRAE